MVSATMMHSPSDLAHSPGDLVHSPGDLAHSPSRLQSCLAAAVGTSTLLEMALTGAGASSVSGKGKHKI